MSKQIIPENAPYPLDLQPGDYWWCACGLSKSQPFCDGTHRTTTLLPVKFTIEKTGYQWLCGCKQSLNKPFCDGQHKQL